MPVLNKPRRDRGIRSSLYKDNNTSNKYYNTKQWINLRNWYMKRNPICEECYKNNIITPATQVHHIKPFMSAYSEDDRWELLLDRNNLMSVCNACHKDIHRELKGCRRNNDRLKEISEL